MQIVRTIPLSVERYVELGYHRRIKNLAKCPHCEANHCLVALGYYLRNLATEDRQVLRIAIRRFRCSRCGKTVSILPSFAQPYRLVRNAIIHRFFSTGAFVEALPWVPLLKSYWQRFSRWIPDIRVAIGKSISRAPPLRSPEDWWTLLISVLGGLGNITKQLIDRFGITPFGRYRCHSPNP